MDLRKTAFRAEEKINILIVDDEPGYLKVMSQFVSSMGYGCFSVENGAAAVEQLQKDDYDIVFTDMVMPLMDGMQLLRYIKEFFPDTDVVVVTSFSENFRYSDVISAGAMDYIVKPFTKNELQAKLKRIIRERKLIRSYREEIQARKLTEEKLQEKSHELGERIKELNCLFKIAELARTQGLSREELLQKTVDFIPAGWQFPEITCVRIAVRGKEYVTDNFRESAWKQASDITVLGKKFGSLEVCYLAERPAAHEGPFLKEERSLINAITERLGVVFGRQQTEDALINSERKFRGLAESSLTGIMIVINGMVVYRNPEFTRIFGKLPQILHLPEISSIHPDDRKKLKQHYQKIISKKTQTMDIIFRFFSAGNKADQYDLKWVHCLANQFEYQAERAVLFNFMDITRLMELEHIVNIQDKMSSLGRVATGIAHEIRNPLSTINVYLSTMKNLLREASGGTENIDSDSIQEVIREMEHASNKIEVVVRRVMDFSRPAVKNLSLCDVNECVQEAAGLAAVALKKSSISMELELTENLPGCYLDKQLIIQVILNLITNAVEAMEATPQDTKQIKITTLAKKHKNKKFILIMVADSGPGIPAEFRNKIFDPFFTTKKSGTGIGLSICQRIVNDQHGILSVSVSEWNGSQFTIEFPIDKRGIE